MNLTGNRYIFGTSETLILTPNATPFEINKLYGYATPSLPIAIAGSNYQVSGFVNASDPNYGNVFTQDTLDNVFISGLTFTMPTQKASTPTGAYPITMIGTGAATQGYGVSYNNNNTFGTFNVIQNTNSVTPISLSVNPSMIHSNIRPSYKNEATRPKKPLLKIETSSGTASPSSPTFVVSSVNTNIPEATETN